MKIQVLHTNDLHNHFPGRTLERLKNSPCLLLDSGDALRGSNTVFHWKEPILQAMNKMGYHAMAMGNREFHYIRKILRKRMRDAEFPILSANLMDLRNRLSVPGFFVYSYQQLRIGVFGLTVPQYKEESGWEKVTGWRFCDPVQTAGRIIRQLKESGVHLIFCLSHLGFPQDRSLAGQVSGIHVIFGGHSHTFLPEVVRQGETAIVQGGAYGNFVGNWNVEVEFSGETMTSWKFSGSLVPVTESQARHAN